MSRKDQKLINKIEELELQLRELRLELTRERPQSPTPLSIGDKVVIKNPSKGQSDRGTLVKIHPTKRGTVLTADTNNKEIKVIRLLKNLERIQNDN